MIIILIIYMNASSTECPPIKIVILFTIALNPGWTSGV